MRKGHFMELLPLNFYSLNQAVDFISQKTNTQIKENLLYSYATEEKIKFLVKIEIENNRLIKVGRNKVDGFFVTAGSELFFKKSMLNQEIKNSISLNDEFCSIDVDNIANLSQDGEDFFLSFNQSKTVRFNGYVVLHAELLDFFIKQSKPLHNIKNTNYLELDSFTAQSPIDSDVFADFNFSMDYPLYNEDQQLYIHHTLMINFNDIKIHYNDLLNLFPSAQAYQTQAKLNKELERIQAELKLKEQKIIELESELKSKNAPILLNKYRNDDLLKIAIEVRNKYWSSYPENVKSNTQIKEYIVRDYGVSQTTAAEIEKIACPINRKKN